MPLAYVYIYVHAVIIVVNVDEDIDIDTVEWNNDDEQNERYIFEDNLYYS